MLKWVARDIKGTILLCVTSAFLSADGVIVNIHTFHSQAAHNRWMSRLNAPGKELILVARVHVNKMAFCERGCGELHSSCLVIS